MQTYIYNINEKENIKNKKYKQYVNIDYHDEIHIYIYKKKNKNSKQKNYITNMYIRINHNAGKIYEPGFTTSMTYMISFKLKYTHHRHAIYEIHKKKQKC